MPIIARDACVALAVSSTLLASDWLFRQQKARSEEQSKAADEQAKAADRQNSRVNPALEEQLKRLQEERDSLLKTGVFDTEDDMILELERQIRALIHSIDHDT